MPPRSRSLRSDDRGQTLEDYAIGIGIFLVTVFFVVAFILPSMLAPFETDVSGDSEARAERVSTSIVQNASEPGSLNHLNTSVIEGIADLDTDGLRDRFNITETSWVNVSVTTLNGSEIVENGTPLSTTESPSGRQTATYSRVVTLTDGDCSPACRLIVRSW